MTTRALTLPQSTIASTFTPAHSGVLQRKCACGGTPGPTGECEQCRRKREATLQRRAAGSGPDTVPPIVHEVLRSPGQALDTTTRAFMEPRFGYDFSRVRVHTDVNAAESARAVNALAYTVGQHVVFANGQFSPRSGSGRWIMGHELAHVVQQNSQPIPTGKGIELDSSAQNELQANAAATALEHADNPVIPARDAAVSIMRLTPENFRAQLGGTPDQKKATDALFADQTFLSLWQYLRDCPATPKKDLGPLNLKVSPGLKIDGVERFGGYSPVTRTLEINPSKPEHSSNPAELVDTIVHELLHAVTLLENQCVQAGSPAAPLGGAKSIRPPARADVAGTPAEDRLLQEVGPGASNPCEEFIDINKAAQQIIVQIIKRNIQITGIGKPTLTFVNEVLRTDPTAMTEYKLCRDVACAKPTKAERDLAIAACSAKTLTRVVIPPLPKPGLKPPAPKRPRFESLIPLRKDFTKEILKSAEDL